MSGGFPIGFDVCNARNIGANTANSFGTAITSGSSANTKGAWTQLTASSPVDAVMAMMTIYYAINSGGVYTNALDIGIGASGAEVVVVSNIIVAAGYNGASLSFITFPIMIRAGSRISLRSQSGKASDITYINLTLLEGGLTQIEGASGIDAIGFSSASTSGTSITPSSTANTMGSYAQLTAATARDYIGIFAACTDPAGGSGIYLADIAVGGSGSEAVIVPDFPIVLVNNTFINGFLPFLPINIASGSRISARLQSSSASAASLGLVVYGVYQ